MGIRETMRGKPVISSSIALLVAVGAVAYTIRSVSPSNSYGRAYFTTDDGASLFSENVDQLAPFDHHGNQAVRAWVFSCDGGKTKFVAYLERCTPAGLQRLAAERSAYEAGKTHRPPQPNPDEIEVKKPGAGNPWVRWSDPAAAAISNVSCPSGGVPEAQTP
jgi:hypothetical protein